MKKNSNHNNIQKTAFIDQIALWSILMIMTVGFVATVSDKKLAKSEYFNIERVVTSASKAAANSYMMNSDMSTAQDMANDIISQGYLGEKLVNSNSISYIWRDTTGDGEPNTVTAAVNNYVHESFWFKMFDLDTFTLSSNFTVSVDKEDEEVVSISARFGGSNAGYHNVIGTYELDANNCIINPSLLLVDKNAHEVGDELGAYSNPNTRYFIIPDGFDLYGDRTMDLDSSSITITNNNDCNPPNVPDVTIDGITNAGPIYFQDTEFNTDNGYDHMREVAKTYHDDYLGFLANPPSRTVEETVTERRCTGFVWRGRCYRGSWVEETTTVTTTEPYEDTWEGWVEYAADENIDFENDPNNEYMIAMEDLPNGGDKDFNDILLDTTKVTVPGVVDTADVEDAEILEP